jgi:hypothetical protein
MADQNPTGGPRVVPIDLPPAQIDILRDELLGWLAGIEEDLATDRPAATSAVAREADAFRRLLAALDHGGIELPDEEARRALERASEGYDAASNYPHICAVHDAHRALLSLLG